MTDMVQSTLHGQGNVEIDAAAVSTALGGETSDTLSTAGRADVASMLPSLIAIEKGHSHKQ